MGKEALKHTGDATLLRRVNRSAILELIRDRGPISRSELARLLRLSPPTITRIVNPLIEAGLVIEGEPGDSRGGRRPILLELNHRASLIIGVYVHQNMVGALVDLNGEILERAAAPSVPGEAGVRQLIDLIDRLRQASDRFGAPVRGIGIGAPSVTWFKEGVVTWAPVLEWRDFPLKQRLEKALDLPVFVENEVNLIALGESWRGAGQGVPNLLCLSLGAGIGAGIIIDGRLYRGAHDAAGEVGYIIPNERYLGQKYDHYGCLESLAGSTGIVARAWQRLQAGQSSVLAPLAADNPAELTVQAVLAAARADDLLARTVLEETIEYLSIAVINLVTILDPERVVISGDLTEFGDLFIEPIRANLARAVQVVPELMMSDLGLDAPLLGAVAIALRHTSDWLFVQGQV